MAVEPQSRPRPWVTRDVEPAQVRDLLERPPRAALAVVVDGEIDAIPACARLVGGRQFIGVVVGIAWIVPEQEEVVLLIDDGSYWFELRGITLRGRAVRTVPPDDVPAGMAWFEFVPRKVLAWDYATLHEE